MNQLQRLEEFVSRMTPEQYARLLAFAASLLDKGASPSERETAPQSAELTEAELLQRIQQGFPESLRQRLRELTRKSEAEALNDEERAEYIALAEQREAADAERMQAVFTLAQRRGVSPRPLMAGLRSEAGIRWPRKN